MTTWPVLSVTTFLPLVEAHVEYLGRARYDDLLQLTVTLAFSGRARAI